MPDLDAFSYVPDVTPDDEEQRRRNALLSLPLSPAKPPMLGALPPDPVKLMGADDNGPYREPDSGLVRRGAGAKFDPQAEYERQVQMGPPTPVAAEHRPFWKTALGALGEGMLGGPEGAREFINAPQERANLQNKTNFTLYDEKVKGLGKLVEDEGQADLRNAQKTQYGMVPVTLPDGSTIQVQQKDAARLTGTLQTNVTKQTPQQLYEAAVRDAVARGVDPNQDLKVLQLADTITRIQKDPSQAKPTDEDKAVTDWMAARNLPDSAANRDKARKALKLETQRPIPEPGNYQPVTDAQGNVVGWVDPKSGKSRAVKDIPGVGQMIGGGNAIPRKPTGQEESRLAQAGVVQRAGDDLIGQIQQNKAKIGNMGAILNSAFLGTPMSDPVSSGIAAQIASFAALNPAMHGFRGTDALKQFEKLLGGLPNNPDSMIAAIKGIQRTASAFNPAQGGGNSGNFSVVAPNGKTYTFSDQKSLDDFKKEAGIK